MQLNFNELITTNLNSLNVEQKEFVELHQGIIQDATDTAKSLIKMSKKLKEMKDKKLYEISGFDTFTEYVEVAVGIKERQAYNYIKVYDELTEDFLHSNAKLGISKLTLLTGVAEDNRTKLLENNDIDDITVKDLKDKIKSLEEEKKQLTLDLESFEDAEEQILTLEEEKENLEAEKAKLKIELNDLNNKPKEIEYYDNPEIEEELSKTKEELSNKENELKSLNEEIESLNKKIILNDASISKFKIKFEDFQRITNEMFEYLNEVDAQKQINLKQAIKSVVESWPL